MKKSAFCVWCIESLKGPDTLFGIIPKNSTRVSYCILQNYTAIVDYEKRSCYIMKLDRVKVTPPKDWIDLIQKFAVCMKYSIQIISITNEGPSAP